jgi:gamma-glutamyltranspeptidase/glutathione hydrolase
VGLGSVAVPGCLAGYLHVHDALGRLEREVVIAPAARLAREGVVLNAHHAYLVRLLEPILCRSSAGRAIYTRGGAPLAEGERLVNAELADFLDRIAAGSDRGFDAAFLAEAIAHDMRGSGRLTAADLRAYRVVERTPLAASFRGREVLTNPPPSGGGRLLAVALGLLDERTAPKAWGAPDHLVALVEAMIETEAVRARRDETERPRFGRGTTHLSVCDADGNVAAMTSSNGESSGYIAPGTGVMFNNMLGEDDLHPDGFHRDEPGVRVASMMSPTLLLREGGVELALGSGGSKRIRTAILQVIQNVVEFGMEVGAAVAAPRVHWDGVSVQAEPGLPDPALKALEARWRVERWERPNLYFGGVHAVAPAGEGAGDPRRGGASAECAAATSHRQ